MSVDTLQQKLEIKARKLMLKEREALCDFLNKNKYAEAIELTVKWNDQESLRSIKLKDLMIIINHHTFELKLSEENALPYFVNKVTTEFMNKVDSLSTQIDELQSSVSGSVDPF